MKRGSCCAILIIVMFACPGVSISSPQGQLDLAHVSRALHEIDTGLALASHDDQKGLMLMWSALFRYYLKDYGKALDQCVDAQKILKNEYAVFVVHGKILRELGRDSEAKIQFAAAGFAFPTKDNLNQLVARSEAEAILSNSPDWAVLVRECALREFQPEVPVALVDEIQREMLGVRSKVVANGKAKEMTIRAELLAARDFSDFNVADGRTFSIENDLAHAFKLFDVCKSGMECEALVHVDEGMTILFLSNPRMIDTENEPSGDIIRQAAQWRSDFNEQRQYYKAELRSVDIENQFSKDIEGEKFWVYETVVSWKYPDNPFLTTKVCMFAVVKRGTKWYFIPA